MKTTRAQTWQWLAIITVSLVLGAGYWYFSARAGSKLNAPQTGTLTSGLVGYWTFDGADSTASTVTDKSGSGNNGTLNNSPQKVPGKVGQALNFWPNGVDTGAYINMGDPGGGQLDFGSGDFSVGFWMKTSGYVDQSSSINVPLSKTAVGTGNAAGYYFQYGSSNTLQFVIRNGSSTYAVSTPASIVGDWHYFMGVRNGSTMYFYQDGTSVGSTAVSGSTSNSEFFQVGSYGAGGPYFNVNGSMDEVRVYNRALAAGEIQSLYDLGASDKINSSVSQKQGGGTLANGLAGYWALDENTGTNAADSSTNGNAGTLTSGPTWSTGQIGSAVNFDGTDDIVTTSADVLDQGTGNFSMAAWINAPNANQAAGFIVGKRQNGGGYPQYGMVAGHINSGGVPQSSKKVSCIYYDGVFVDNTHMQNYRTTNDVLDGNWHQVVCNRVNGQAVQIFVDGVAAAVTAEVSNTTNVNVNNSGAFTLGASDGATLPYTGKIDEARLYSRALSSDEVSQLYRLTTPTAVDTSLKGYWSFDGEDVSGTTAYDRSGVGNNGTLTNSPAVTPGAVGQALNFDGSNDNVLLGDVVEPTGPITVTAWVQPASFAAAGYRIVSKWGGSSNQDSYLLSQDDGGNGKFRFAVRLSGGAEYCDTTSVATLGTWTFVVGTWDGSNCHTYFNGTEETTKSEYGSGPLMSGSTNLRIGIEGSDGTSNPYSGKIDEVRIYNRALAASEVQSLYDQGAPDKINSATSTPQGTGRLDSGLAGYWKFDDGSGASATDASPNGNTLTLSNSPTWSTGRIGSSLTFFPSGSDTNALAYVTDPASGVLDFGTGDFAVSFWAKGRGYTAQGSSANVLVGKKNLDASNAAGWYFYISNTSVLGMNVNGGSDASAIYIGGSTPVLNDDTWHHVVGLRTGSTVKLYADGAFLASGTNAGSVSNGISFWTGDDGSTVRNFKGEIDEVRTYNRSLSDDEISQLYRLGTPTGVDTSLKGYWSFNGQDVSGTTAYDRSGVGNTGTLTNGPTVTSGKLGQALNFDGTDDSVQINSTFGLSTTNVTIALWANIPSLPAKGAFIKLGSTTTGYGIGITNGTTTGFETSGSNLTVLYEGVRWIPTGVSPETGWHHFALVVDGSGVPTVYKDGSSVGSFSGTGAVAPVTVTNIGGYTSSVPSNRFFSGKVDEVRVYNRALGASEIAALYNSGR